MTRRPSTQRLLPRSDSWKSGCPGSEARSSSRRGFTLTELMVVVAIAGILATLGMVSFSTELKEARSTEARGVLRAISAAQEGFRAENKTYLDIPNFYPDDTGPAPSNTETMFWGHANEAPWRTLAPTVPARVRYRYRTRAGTPGTPIPNLLIIGDPGWPAPVDPWYTVEAWGDVDEDGDHNVLFVSSFNSRVYEHNPGE